MKIALICFNYPPFIGGAESIAISVVNGLVSRGVEVWVFAPWHPRADPSTIPSGAKIVRLPTLPIPFLFIASFWVSLLLRFPGINAMERFDLVHSFVISDLPLTRKLIRNPRVVSVMHLGQDARTAQSARGIRLLARLRREEGLSVTFERICAMRADSVVAISEYTRTRVIDVFGILQAKVVVACPAAPRLPEAEERAVHLLRKEVLRDRSHLVLYLGRLDQRKGVDVLLRAHSILPLRKRTMLVIVGDGTARQSLDKLAAELGINEDVVFLPSMRGPPLTAILDAADVVVQPSRLEGFGMSTLEALTRGKPVVVTNSGALPELVTGAVAQVVRAEDPLDLAMAIQAVLADQDGLLRARLQNPALVTNRFSERQAIDAILEAYRRATQVCPVLTGQ